MSITSANAVLTISQPILFPVPVQLQGFAADDIYDFEQVRTLEALMGVDGVLSFGFVFAERLQNITLQADSLSNNVFDTIMTQQIAAKDAYPLNGTIILEGIQTMFNMTNGGLLMYNPAPAAKRVLQPRRFQVVWNQVFPAPIV